MIESEKKCAGSIPPEELRRIMDEVIRRTTMEFERLGELPMEYCTECAVMHGRENLLKPHFIVDVERMRATCAWHFAKELEEKLCKEYMDARIPKKPFPVAELKYGGLVPLDVEDFARI